VNKICALCGDVGQLIFCDGCPTAICFVTKTDEAGHPISSGCIPKVALLRESFMCPICCRKSGLPFPVSLVFLTETSNCALTCLKYEIYSSNPCRAFAGRMTKPLLHQCLIPNCPTYEISVTSALSLTLAHVFQLEAPGYVSHIKAKLTYSQSTDSM
jgi:hypothetical protein